MRHNRGHAACGMTAIHELGLMELQNITESHLLASYVKDQLPQITNISDHELVHIVGGYPGVIDRWTCDTNRFSLKTVDELQRVADQARTTRYPEFDQLLSSLSDAERELAMRLAFFPRIEESHWETYKDIILDRLDQDVLYSLQQKNILEEGVTYGHDTRHLEARNWFLSPERNYGWQSQEEISALIFRLAVRVDSPTSTVRPFAEVLAYFGPVVDKLQLRETCRALCVAAQSMFSLENINIKALMAGRLCVRESIEVAPLIAMGLNNALQCAKKRRECDTRDAVLDELRQLHRSTGLETDIREWLACGLYNTLIDADDEDDLLRCQGILCEIRELHSSWPHDDRVREYFAMGLVNAGNYFKARDVLDLRDNCLDELRQLHNSWPQDILIRGFLTNALFNNINDATRENDLTRRDNFLLELRSLAKRFSDDIKVQRELGSALGNTANAHLVVRRLLLVTMSE
jgi:hypothetical protein